MSGPAWSNQIQNRVIVGGPGGGVFVYNGTPGPGNPPIFYVTSASTDPFGNTVTPFAATSLQGSKSAALVNGTLNLLNGTAQGIADISSTGVLGVSSIGTIAANNASVNLFSDKDASGPLIVVNQTVKITQPGAVTIETWHDLGTLAGYTVNRAQYKLGIEGQTWLYINVTSGGANAASVNFSNTLPAAYRPTQVVFQPLTSSGASTAPVRVSLSAAGGVQITQQANNAIQILGVVPIPLD